MAAGFCAAAGFLAAVAGRFLAGFFAGAGGAAVSSTLTGFGLKVGAAPVFDTISNVSVAVWKPFSEKVTVTGPEVGNASAQGVRQVCPLEALASAPGGSDSKRTVSIDGAGLNASVQSEPPDVHAANASAPPTIAITRYIVFKPVHSSDMIARPLQGYGRGKDRATRLTTLTLTPLTMGPQRGINWPK